MAMELTTDLETIERLREDLARSEARYRATFDTATVGLAVLSAEGRFLDANETFCRYLGYPLDELLRLGFPDVTHPDDLAETARAIQASLASGGASFEIDKRCLKKDGSFAWANVHAKWLAADNGAPPVLLAFINDITRRKEADSALRDSEARMRVVIERVPAVLWSTDRSLRFTLSLGAGLVGLGLTPNEVVGMSLYDYFRTQDSEFVPIAMHRRALNGESVSYDLTWDGRTFRSRVEPLRGEAGAIVGTIGAAHDVTDSTASELALRNSEARKTAILESAPDPIAIIDQDGRVTEFNAAAERILGYSRDAVRGRDLLEVLVPPSARGKDWVAFPWPTASGGGLPIGQRCQLTAVSADGTQVPIEMAVARIPGDGPPICTAHIRDLTTQRMTEAALREREEQVRHSQKMDAIGALAGGVAHDFNNILTGILGQAEMLRIGPRTPERVAESVAIIERAAQRAAQLTQQLLGFARRGKHQNIPVDLRAAAQEVVLLLRRTMEKSIAIVEEFRAPNPWVLGDPEQIQQVILNLAVNARDAMPAGGTLTIGTVAVGGGARIEDGLFIELFLTDTGSGIVPQIRDRIFDPFFTTKEQGKGTGMGLPMVYGIVKNHGGTIRFDTEPGRGTTFHVSLPLTTPPEGVVVKAPPPAVRGRGRVLVVDDEEVVRGVVAQYLAVLGYDVLTANDGVEAIELYKRRGSDIDLVLMDMMMPRMGGRECFLAMRALNPSVRGVLSTGFGMNTAAQETLDTGMSGFIQKPYSLQQLSEVVAQALGEPLRS